jgi:hypothetical protein
MAPRGASKPKSKSSTKSITKPRSAARKAVKKPAKPVAPRTRSARTTSELKPKPRGAAASKKGTAAKASTARKPAGTKKTQAAKPRSSSVLGTAVQKALPFVPSWSGLGRWVGRTVG